MSGITIANLTFTILNFILLVLIIAGSIAALNEAKNQFSEVLSVLLQKLNTNTPN
tara:strand:+ start:5690 stop:5854 length:165 start_codon:yes stop_codon:yes gene_type:complete